MICLPLLKKTKHSVANILILHSGLSGITNACLEIANRLESSNHQVWTATMSQNTEVISKNGYKHLKIKSIKIDYDKVGNFAKHLKTAFFSKKTFFDNLYHNLEFSEFQKKLNHHKIDLLLIDLELHEYIIYLKSKNIPFLLINQWFSIWKTENSLPLDSKEIPTSKFQQNLIWKRNSLMKRFKTLGHHIKTVGLNRRKFILYLAKKMNFDTHEFQRNAFPLPFAYKSFPVISTTHPDLETQTKKRDKLDYIFPMVLQDRKEEVSNTFQKDFNHILEQKKKKLKKIIVVTKTTMKGQDKQSSILLIKALAQLDDYISIISVGSNANLTEWASYKKENLFIYNTIPN